MNEEFEKWLWLVVEHKMIKRRNDIEPQDILGQIYLTDAKLAFIEGMTPEEYCKDMFIKY